ncbi:retinol dehydrogenase 11-like [Hyposmocoma kahamanoa]|uniref:retinol dehydrogenase 11-like n=1 Tax=Hyposmocoma kahamanoa TaxID=1477025 RepID=UPI000E6D8096|nr:retinol dehydrogenase 11-like [Hyposmocoma kahamanoa]
MAVLVIVIIIAIAFVIRFYEKSTNAICQSQKKLDGRVAIVTGGTCGMGLEIAKEFARRGAKVIIACPFNEEGINARKEIIELTGNNDIVFKLMDLSSIDSVKKFAAGILKSEDRLDILVNNAGVGVPNDFTTADGMSFIMQVNYFGHFLLSLLLLPLLMKTGKSSDPARIVNTSSVMHHFGMVDMDTLNKTDYWIKSLIYSKSKICLVLFAHEFTKRLKGYNVVINSVDPGAVGTGIFNSAGKLRGMLLKFLCLYLYKTPYEGAQTAIHVALDQEAGSVSGHFFKNCKKTRAVFWAYNNKVARQLFEESVRLVKLNQEDVDNCFKSL